MKILHYQRGAGKTENIIEYAMKNNCDIVTFNTSGKEHLQNRIKNKIQAGDYYPVVYSIGNFLERGLIKNKNIVIDELEMSLRELLGTDIEMVSTDAENSDIHKEKYMDSQLPTTLKGSGL